LADGGEDGLVCGDDILHRCDLRQLELDLLALQRHVAQEELDRAQIAGEGLLEGDTQQVLELRADDFMKGGAEPVLAAGRPASRIAGLAWLEGTTWSATARWLFLQRIISQLGWLLARLIGHYRCSAR